MSDIPPLSRAPWYSTMTTQMGPVITVMFILLFVVVKLTLGPISKIPELVEKQDEVLYQLKISVHFDWANCMNQAKDDPVAQSRCIPPADKRDERSSDQGYIFNLPSVALAPVAHANGAEEKSFSGSSSSVARITPRTAEANAARQNQERLENLKAKGLGKVTNSL